MSTTVNIKTEKRPKPNAIFRKLKELGEQIVVTSNNYPYLKFGINKKSLRGVEINEGEQGLEVRVNSCSSLADYKLFVETIKILTDLTDSHFIYQDSELSTPYQTFNDEWIKKEFEAGWHTVSILVKHSCTAVVMFGLFIPYCVGPNLLNYYKVNLKGSCEFDTYSFKDLTEYLLIFQWGLRYAKDTQSRLVLPNPKSSKDTPLGISLISIEGGKLSDFDYVSYSPLLAISDLDNEETVIIHFEDFHHTVAPSGHFRGFDDWQMKICGDKPSVEEVRHIMTIAKRYVPEDFFYRPTYPGSGYDEKQKTFILFWDPKDSEDTLEDHIRSIQLVYKGRFMQNIEEWKMARMGDRFYVVRIGEGKTGVVMTGVFGSHPFLYPENNKKNKHSIELKLNLILNPETAPMLTTEDLEKSIPDFNWRYKHQGNTLSTIQAKVLEKLFSEYLNTILDKNDGINICITRSI